MQKNYENNMADQDVIVHSIRVLKDIDSPTTRRLTREVNLTKEAARSVAQKSDKYWQELSSDGIITPIEKKIIQREMENIANSYTALYTEAVAEHYETADFFIDYMATYNALRTYIYSTLQLFNNMEENTAVDRDEFNQYFADYYYSENFAIVSMTVGVVSSLGFKILTSLEDEGEDGEVGLYHGELYQYVDNGWRPLDRELYYGKSAVFPPEMEGRYFLNTENSYLDDDLYLSADGEDYEPLELNGENLTVFTDYEKGIIYAYENHHWQPKDPASDYQYLVALGDFYSVNENLPAIFKDEVEDIARRVSGSKYFGYSTVPPEDPEEGDFFLYSGQTTAEIVDHKWIFANLYIYRSGDWVWLDDDEFQNREYYMAALQDILYIASEEDSTAYFSTVFCNSFFGNIAALNALSVQTIFLDTGGVIKSNIYTENEEGLLIDSEGNIDANENTHIGGTCTIDGNITIGGDSEIIGKCIIGGDASIIGSTIIGENCTVKGNIEAGPLILNNSSDPGITYVYPASTIGNESFINEINNRLHSYYVREFYADGNQVTYRLFNEYGQTYSIHLEGPNGYYKYIVKNNGEPIGINIIFTVGASEGTKTFKLLGIPTQRPTAPNMVWNDNGTLKIT